MRAAKGRKSPVKKNWNNKGKTVLRRLLKTLLQEPSLHSILPSSLKKSRQSGLLQSLQADLRWVSRRKMQQFNHHWRKKNYPTDVLSFPAPSPFFDQGFLGDILLCLPVLRAQARHYGQSLEQEMDLLLVHGLLHLLGFDHERSAQAARKMSRAETKWLSILYKDKRGKSRSHPAGGLIKRSE